MEMILIHNKKDPEGANLIKGRGNGIKLEPEVILIHYLSHEVDLLNYIRKLIYLHIKVNFFS